MKQVYAYGMFETSAKQQELLERLYKMEQEKKDGEWSKQAHAWLRRTLDLPDDVFCLAKEQESDTVRLLLFDRKANDEVYYVKTDRDGYPYIETEGR